METLILLLVICCRRRGWKWACFCRRRWKELWSGFATSSWKKMDAPSSFFYNIKKCLAQRKHMACLKPPGGRLTMSQSKMRANANDFYTNLFWAELCSLENHQELLAGHSQLSPEERGPLDCGWTLEELTTAVNWMPSRRAPGIDGFSTDFYQQFWNIIGADLHEVLLECFQDRIPSCIMPVGISLPAA